MLDLSVFAKNFVAATKGTYNGSPRIYNIDRNSYITGYAEINDQATSPYSRIKVHKGLFTCNRGDVLPGDLIQDRVDDNKYLVMSIKDKFCGGASAYFDCALYFCNTEITVSRFTGTGTKDSFGRAVANAPEVIFSNVPVMTDPKNFDTIIHPDRPIEDDKINVYIQSKYAVKVSDRITTPDGDVYEIETIDTAALTNIWICKVNKDVR